MTHTNSPKGIFWFKKGKDWETGNGTERKEKERKDKKKDKRQEKDKRQRGDRSCFAKTDASMVGSEARFEFCKGETLLDV